MKLLSTYLLIPFLFMACTAQQPTGSYGYYVDFFKKQNIETIELTSSDGLSRVMIIPAYQARVMTSSAFGLEGAGYGWINEKYIAQGTTSTQFNPYGGEERFWLGPEGGKFSWFFAPEKEQIYTNWDVPALMDTDIFTPDSISKQFVHFRQEALLTNASGVSFPMELQRSITLLDKEQVSKLFGVQLPDGTSFVAYQTDNSITNTGTDAWTPQTGLPSIWILGMYVPSPTTTVFIPYNKEAEGIIVNDMYFGKVPVDRLKVDEEKGMIYFKIDGKMRTKIGLPQDRATPLIGSYDRAQEILTLVTYTSVQPALDGPALYVNSQWGNQEDPFNGDVLNAYNDGPTEDGTLMGPFFEIETSSPGAALKTGETLHHLQTTLHVQGPAAKELAGTWLEGIV